MAATEKHTLPSGLEVEIRSHRDLRRPDVQKVWAAISGEGNAVAEMRDALIEMLVTSSSKPDQFPVPFTVEVLDRLDADDYLKLYSLMDDAYRLVNGLSVIPRPDDYADPKAPTAATSE